MATPPRELYDSDFYAWTRQQARELRRLKPLRLNGDLDVDRLALEIRDLGSEQLFAVQSQTVRLIEHLLKLAYSTLEQPRRRWMISVNDARAEIENRLTPTLRRRLLASLDRQYERARRNAALALEDQDEAAAAGALPSTCPYGFDQLLDPDWLPARRG
ncbi:MAG: DUF29 domain-containing protein [Geminicoccaceae bacterium]